MTVNKLISFCFFISFIACRNNHTVCNLSVDQVIDKSEKRVIRIKDHGVVTEIRDIGIDTTIGGDYEFFPNGTLESYNFIAKRDTNYDNAKRKLEVIEQYTNSKDAGFSTYGEIYDQTGNVTKTFGKPIVSEKIRITKEDSLIISFYLFSLNKKYLDITLQILDRTPLKLNFEKDSIYTNMQKAKFSSSVKGESKVIIYLKGSYINTCNEQQKELKDTISFNL